MAQDPSVIVVTADIWGHLLCARRCTCYVVIMVLYGLINTLHVLIHIILTVSGKVDTITIPSLQMGEMSHRAVNCTQVHGASKWQRRNSKPGGLAPKSEQ